MYNKDGKIICWWSAGVTSAIACKLAIEAYGKDNVELIYFKIDSAHKDNERFMRECEEWYGVPIQTRRSQKYKDQFDVIEKTRYINGPSGARCTLELKKSVRYAVEKEIDYSHQVFGFEFNKKEINRALRFLEQYPDASPIFPLIEKKMDKAACLHYLEKQGIERPEMYKLGYPNNNPCALNTRILTDCGVYQIGDLIGQKVRLLNRGGWVWADVNHMGVQPTLKLHLERSGRKKYIEFTPDHKWYNVSRRGKRFNGETSDLKVGDFLPVFTDEKCEVTINNEMFVKGMCFGDGSVNGATANIRLFGDKSDILEKMGYVLTEKENHKLLFGLPKEFKTFLPSLESSMDDKLSWIAGWFNTDGSINSNGQTNLSASGDVSHLKDLLNSCGIIVTSVVNNTNEVGNENSKGCLIKATKPNYILNCRVPEWMVMRESHRSNFIKNKRALNGWKIVAIEESSNQEVACATVREGLPEFCLDDGILTGNCIGCVKGGAGYWNKVRVDFPETFNKMVDMEELIGATCLKDKNGRIPLKELDPNRGRDLKIIMPDCGSFCEIEFEDMEHQNLAEVYERGDVIKDFYIK